MRSLVRGRVWGLLRDRKGELLLVCLQTRVGAMDSWSTSEVGEWLLEQGFSQNVVDAFSGESSWNDLLSL